MPTRKINPWSELHTEIFTSILERVSFSDFHRVKLVCSNWYHCCSKQTFHPKIGSPLVMLSSKEDGCGLYSLDEDRVYNTKTDFSKIRFLGNQGNWFLVIDSKSKLYIVDVFTNKRIDLPPLESIRGGKFSLEQVGDEKFEETEDMCSLCYDLRFQSSENLRGVLHVNDKTKDYVVVWRFESYHRCEYVAFCKTGDDHYQEITIYIDVRRELKGLTDMVVKGYNLYILTTHDNIRILDLSGKDDGFKDVSDSHRYGADIGNDSISYVNNNIAVTRLGDVFVVHNVHYDSRDRSFVLYKRIPNEKLSPNVVQVDSLGDEALFLDLGVVVPADPSLGIEPNSIYFTRNDGVRHNQFSFLDICVYNLGTKTIKRFPALSKLKLKDARWFLPMVSPSIIADAFSHP